MSTLNNPQTGLIIRGVFFAIGILVGIVIYSINDFVDFALPLLPENSTAFVWIDLFHIMLIVFVSVAIVVGTYEYFVGNIPPLLTLTMAVVYGFDVGGGFLFWWDLLNTLGIQ